MAFPKRRYHRKSAVEAKTVGAPRRARVEPRTDKECDLLREAAAVSQIGIFELDLGTHSIHWASQAQSIPGWSRDWPATLRELDESIVADDLGNVLEAARRSENPAGDGLVDVVYRVRCADGEICRLRERSRTFFEEVSGKRVPKRRVGIICDMTNGTKSEVEVRRTSDFMSDVLENIPNMIFLKEANGLRFVRVNKATEELVGYSRDELLGKNDYDFFSKEQADFFTKKDREVLSGGKVLDIPEEPVRTKTGGIRILHTKKVPLFDARGEPAYLLGISDDITERIKMEETLRESEQRLRLHVEKTPLGVIEWDTSLRVMSWNPAAERIFGFSASEAMGRHADFIVPADVRASVDRIVKELLARKGGERSTNKNFTKDGRTILCDWYNTPLITHDGQVIGIASLVQDITVQKETETELLEAKETAEIALGMKSQFLDIAAHELKTPVAAFSMMLDLADRQMKKGVPVDPTTLERIRAQAKRLSRLVVDLLDVSRLERGKLALDLSRTDLVAAASVALEAFRIAIPGRKFTLIGPDHPVEVDFDRVKIDQVISNLLDNAVKYTSEGSPVEVSVETFPERVRVSVVDHGPGISEEQNADLFQAFTRGRTDREERISGLGLGLFFCRSIVELHGGTIGVSSEPGIGSTFYFELPRKSNPP